MLMSLRSLGSCHSSRRSAETGDWGLQLRLETPWALCNALGGGGRGHANQGITHKRVSAHRVVVTQRSPSAFRTPCIHALAALHPHLPHALQLFCCRRLCEVVSFSKVFEKRCIESPDYTPDLSRRPWIGWSLDRREYGSRKKFGKGGPPGLQTL